MFKVTTTSLQELDMSSTLSYNWW